MLDPLALAAVAGFPAARAHVLVRRPGRLVARLDDAAVLKADIAGAAFEPEVAAIDRLAAAALPVPRVLAHVPGEPAILILSWTDGGAVSSADALPVQQDVGRLLRRVHRLGAGPPFSGRPSVAAWIADWLDEVATWWLRHGGARAPTARLRHWHRTLRPLLEQRTGELMLFDARPEHFRVDRTGTVRLIDLHDLGPGDAAMDLAAIHLDDPRLTPGVVDGYQPSAAEREAFAALVPFFTVIRALAAAEWSMRHGAADGVPALLVRAADEVG
jgi:Ser/Thr protein kinase RdoA (MazF antagonist)